MSKTCRLYSGYAIRKENTEECFVELAPGAEIVNTQIKCYAVPKRLFFPKNTTWENMQPNSFGIAKFEMVQVLEGQVPEEFSTSLVIKDETFIEFVAKGKQMCRLNPGGVYEILGTIVEDMKFGFQIDISYISSVYSLDTPEDREAFLRLAIGDAKAELLIANFPNPIEVLDKGDIKLLTRVKGIAEHTAKKILENYQANRASGADISRLMSKYLLSATQSQKLLATFNSYDTVEWLIINNPYAFIDRVDGFGWQTTDTIAINNGFNPNGAPRIAAFIDYYLRALANDIGHLWIPLEELVAAILDIAPTLNPSDLQEMLWLWTGKKAPEDTIPWLFYEDDTKRIGLTYYRKMEEEIAAELFRLQKAPSKVYTDDEIEAAIKQAEDDCGYEYTEQQREAIYGSFRNNVVLITGGAGVGKSSSVKPIVNTLKNANLPFHQCALSGKASSNLSEITGTEGFTIHRMLRYDPARGSFSANSHNPLRTTMVILDELSMVNDYIFLSALRAIPSGAKLICLGDIQQLETIGAGSVCADILYSPLLPTYHLTKIHRQAAKSGIITESIRIAAGEQIITSLPIEETRGELQDFKIRTYGENVLTADYIVQEYTKLYEQGVSYKDMMIVVPMRTRSDSSCLALNKRIQSIVNGIPRTDDVTLGDLEKDGYILRVGDKILITKNNYKDCYLEGVDPESKNKFPIFNGNTGYIREIYEKYIIVDLIQQRGVIIPKHIWFNVELGYALTCHKAQGIGVPYVIAGIDNRAYTLLSKEWLYTAMTRAKKYCVLVGQISAIKTAIKTSHVLHKRTYLGDALEQENKAWSQDGVRLVPHEVLKLGEYAYKPLEIVNVEKALFHQVNRLGDEVYE